MSTAPATLDRIRHHLVGLRMPRSLEVLEHLLRQLERGEISALEAIDQSLDKELSLREGRRVKTALKMGRLLSIKTLAGFDFTFQPSLDRNRILTLAGLDFIARHEVIHFLGQPGCGKTHLVIALAVEAVQAGRSVYFTTPAELISSLAKAEREGTLRERMRFLCRSQLLVVDEIGYLPVVAGGGNLFFQLLNARYERDAMILTSNRGFAEWAKCSATASLPQPCWTACCTTPSSCASRAPATASAAMPTYCRTPPCHGRCTSRTPHRGAGAGRPSHARPSSTARRSRQPIWGIFSQRFWGNKPQH